MQISSINGDLLGCNVFVYCFNNPIILGDPAGNWPKLKKALTDAWNSVKGFVNKTFGAGVVQSQTYEAFKFETIIYGSESGVSTSGVIKGDISKPVSVYAETASKWWKITEYKVGVQINSNGGGFSYSTNTLETSITFSDQNNSLELISGLNKMAYTYKTGVSFDSKSASLYSHEYIRTIPTAVAVAGSIVACYYTGGAAAPYIISIFGAGVSYAA